MKNKLLNTLMAGILFLMPNVIFGQTINLGTAANFVLFTTVGAVTNSGIPHLTHLTGNVGSNSGSSTGFGNVDGVMDDGNLVSGAAAADLLIAYGQLNTALPTFFPAPLLGNGDTLIPGVYHIPSAAIINQDLILNAQGNPNAVFIFQVQGPLSIHTAAKIKLINGAVACNVFWKVEGLVSVASDATMRGTIVAHNAAINMNTNDTLEGRALSINGAVTTNAILAYTPIGCGSPVLTGPAAPALVSVAAYGIFSSIGPVANVGTTHVVGDVGTNSGLTTNFDPLLVTGTIHPVPDASTTAAAGDMTNVYNYLNTLTPDINLLYPAQFGNDLVLTPHTYHMGAVLTYTGNIYLNAEGNTNAVFVLQINGALSTSTFSKVILINGAQAKNVYWKVDGAVHIYDNSNFNGTIVSAGAITLNNATTLSGRVLTINGAISINASDISLPSDTVCVAPAITGIMHVCPASTTTLADSVTGGTWTSSNIIVATIDSSGVVTGVSSGTATISYTTPAGCVSGTVVTVDASPLPITGAGNVCIGSTITLSDLTSFGIWSSSNTLQATVGSGSGIVTGVAKGSPVIRYTIANGCSASKTIVVGANAGVITGPSRVCLGSSITLTDTVAGGAWSSSNAKAVVLSGTVVGVTAGIDTIMYMVTDICGTDTAMKIVTVDTFQSAGIINGASTVCAGASTTLTDLTTGGTWSSSNARAMVSGGVVTGISGGIDTIRYIVTNACASDTASKIITIRPLADEGSISGPSSVCAGSSILLTDGAAGGTWSSSNPRATVIAGIVTGVSAGIDTIRYSVTNTCGTATASAIITIDTFQNAGIINGPSSVCIGSIITLTDGVAGGIWTSSNTSAMVLGGVVTGVSTGMDTISYVVTNACGIDTATKTIVVDTFQSAGIITGAPSVCVGSTVTLIDLVTGGVWSSFNTTATVTPAGGVVTGVSPGMDTIMYTVTNACGINVATTTIVVNPIPDPGTINGPSSVCIGASITLTDGVTGGAWTGSNATATVIGNVLVGITSGTDTIMYTVSDLGCTAVATKIIVVNPLANTGSITGPSTVCVGSSITLTDLATGGTWSSSNANATVIDGMVTGVTVGTDIISYSVTNVCGTLSATKSIIINALPAVPVIATQSPSSVCTGTMFQNFGASTTAAPGVDYEWSVANAMISDTGSTS